MKHEARSDAGAFEWNRGGWFGTQVGATLWLVLLGGLLMAQSRPVGGLVLASGLVPNLLGVLLWRRRHSVSAYHGIQALLAACGIGALVAMACLRVSSDQGASADLPSAWLLLLYPGLMLVLHLRERSAAKDAT